MPDRSYTVTVAVSVDAGSAVDAACLAMQALADPEECCLETRVEVLACGASGSEVFEFVGSRLSGVSA